MSNNRNPELRFRAPPELREDVELVAKVFARETGKEANLAELTRFLVEQGLDALYENNPAVTRAFDERAKEGD